MHELQYGDILTFTNQADASDNVIAPVILALEHTVWADLRSYTNEDFWEPNGFGRAEVMLTSSESAAPIRGEVPFASVCRCAEGIVRQVFRQRGTGNEVGITFPLSAFSVSPSSPTAKRGSQRIPAPRAGCLARSHIIGKLLSSPARTLRKGSNFVAGPARREVIWG